MNAHPALLRALISALSLLAAGAALAAPPEAGEILEKMEKTINGYADQQMEIFLTIVDTDGSKKSYEFTVWQKGDQRRLIQFTSGEMKGMATLVEDRNNVYVYLPGYRKVRRVAAHNMNQSFAGSDFTNDDMASVSYAKLYSARLGSEDAEAWHLVATPKPGEPSDYGKVLFTVDKKTYQQVEAVYFNKAGEKVKVFNNSLFTDWGGGAVRAKRVIVSDPRTGHRTEMDIKAFKVNTGLDDDLFTIRHLQWGK